VQCDVCHSIKSSTSLETDGHEPHNASFIIEPGKTKRGPFKDGDSPHHDVAYSELHTSAEFCANCHHVFHPVNNFPIERTYDEWKNSVYSQNGIICQDCHMADVEDAVEIARTMKKVKRAGKASNDGPDRDHIYKHNFDGANFTIPGLLGYTKHSEAATKRLQSAAQLEVISPDEFKAGKMGGFKVKVTNVAAGHNLPTSLTEVRQMWLEVEVTDEAGKKILHSGWLDKEHNVDPDAAMFNAVSVDKDGKHTVKPWEIVRFESNTTIPPKGSAVQNYNFEIPSGTKGNLQVKAILRYRSYPQAVANLLLGKGAPVLPIVDMTVASKSVKIIK
jgi:Zn-finger protein